MSVAVDSRPAGAGVGPEGVRPESADPEALGLEVRRLGGTIGAEVRGIDLRQPLDAATVAAIRRLWLDHKVLFFPGQHLEPHHQVALGRTFGDLTPAHPVVPGAIAEHPEVLVLDSHVTRDRDEYAWIRNRPRVEGWHTDVTFVETPPDGSILSGRVIPEAGGDTLWADTQAAYANLAPPLRRLVDELTAVHDGNATFGGFLARSHAIEWDGRRYDRLDPVEHPVVRTHPETGRRSLFVNPGFTTHVVGLSRQESDGLLALLYDHMTAPEHVVRHKWQAGDVAFWDNRSTLHYAAQDYGGAHRVMHRVTLRGSRPFR
ncbi:MAG TPA: TauD/TfdA family dioxygenase [Acidimicrobiales bacterium]